MKKLIVAATVVFAMVLGGAGVASANDLKEARKNICDFVDWDAPLLYPLNRPNQC